MQVEETIVTHIDKRGLKWCVHVMIIENDDVQENMETCKLKMDNVLDRHYVPRHCTRHIKNHF